jgi:hypothetical protein
MATATKRVMMTNSDNTGNGYGKEAMVCVCVLVCVERAQNKEESKIVNVS